MCFLIVSVAVIYIKLSVLKTIRIELLFGISYILNSMLFSDVEVYFFFVESSNFCLKVVWRSISSHGILNLLLLIGCISYRLQFDFRIYFQFLFSSRQEYY
jgi:hypothetical protein